MTKAPTSTSPSKKTHRKKFRPTLWLPNPSTSADPMPGDIQPESSSQESKAARELYWMPRDIFNKQPDRHSEEQEALSIESSSDNPNEAEVRGYPELDEVEKPLDDVAIEAQLGDELLADSNQNLDSDSLRSEPKSHLEGHYLPYLLEAKACRHSDERCVNNNCRRKLDMGSSAVQLWRCVSCFGGRVLCTSCIVQSHQYQPFHELHGYIHHAAALSRTSSRWKNSLPNDFGYFKRLSLQEAGLQVGLSHDSDLCPSSSEGDSFRMTILHINGQHSVTFRDCGCQGKERWQLLLEYNVFPVTEKQPETGFTIELLEHQRAFNLRGKTSLQEYYQALLDLTNAAEGRATKSFSNAYDQLRDGTRQFRGLCTHMRAGRYDATLPLGNGELCVRCPACPRPGVNLPPNWERDPLKQLRYVQFFCGDGNFKLQRLAKRKSAKNDPLLQESMFGDGAFWAPQKIHDTYIANSPAAADEPKGGHRNACNTMAGDPAISPEGAHAVDVTGVFCVSCRHVSVCPNGVVDFHKGERFRPVDVAFSGPLQESYLGGLRYFVITYDIACKYGVNFKSRCFNENPQEALIPTPQGEMFIAFCVNKFHQESHEESCSSRNALNYTKFVGRTCGEGVETIWAKMNWLRYSTREMSPGNRRETLSEHFNDWNWQKLIGIGGFSREHSEIADDPEMRPTLVDSIRTAYLKALEAFAGVRERLENLKNSLGSKAVAELEERYVSSGGEQFLEELDGLKWLSRKDLLLKMREIEGHGNGETDHTQEQSVSSIDFICKALQLEEMQAKLRQRAHDISQLGPNATPQMKAQLTSLRTKLESGLRQHYEILEEVAPQLAQSGHRVVPDAPQDDEILLPSRLTAEEVEALGLGPLLTIEVQLRIGHAYNALAALKKALGMRSFWTRLGTGKG